MTISIDDESLIIPTYLPRRGYGQIHQHKAHFFERAHITQAREVSCDLNQLVTKLVKGLSRLSCMGHLAQTSLFKHVCYEADRDSASQRIPLSEGEDL